jgi:enoyl-CoA hydratase/carnithine racemase
VNSNMNTSWTAGHTGTRVNTVRSSGLLEVRLSHGSVNALDAATYHEIQEVFSAVDANPSIGVVLLLGDSGCFSAGQDVGDALIIATDCESYLSAAADALISVTVSEAIVVAGIQRFAIGAGLILAASADLLVIDEAAQLTLPELDYGVVAGAAHLSRWLGPTAAERALMTGEAIEPRRFAHSGATIIDAEKVETTAAQLAEDQARRDPALARLAKAISARDRLTLAERYRSEIRATIAAGLTDFTPPGK